MQYIIDKVINANSKSINDITLLEFVDFFKSEDLEQLMWATKQTQLIGQEEPVTGKKPSAIHFRSLIKNDFFKQLQQTVRSKEFKRAILAKFGIEDDYFVDLLQCDETIHTDQGHQYDQAHSDQKNNLFSITFQIYLPETNDDAHYGTVFYDNKDNELYRTQFINNTGYCFLSHNNSWHNGEPGISRNSFFIRMDIKPHYEKTSTVFNYDKTVDTCYLIWDKDMEVPRHYTDYLLQVSMLNAQELDIENVVVSQNPWRNKCQLFSKLKELGFNKALVCLGGVHWDSRKAIEHAQQLELDVSVAGRKNSDSLLRQFAIVNINSVVDTFPNTDKYFGDCISKNDFVELNDNFEDDKSFYHIDDDTMDDFLCWIKWSEEFKHKDKDYLRAYKQNNKSLINLTRSMHKG